MKITVCDPPSGWKYGFPRTIPQNVLEAIEQERRESNNTRNAFIEWLLKCGYPQQIIDLHGDHFFCRFWEEEIDLVESGC